MFAGWLSQSGRREKRRESDVPNNVSWSSEANCSTLDIQVSLVGTLAGCTNGFSINRVVLSKKNHSLPLKNATSGLSTSNSCCSSSQERSRSPVSMASRSLAPSIGSGTSFTASLRAMAWLMSAK